MGFLSIARPFTRMFVLAGSLLPGLSLAQDQPASPPLDQSGAQSAVPQSAQSAQAAGQLGTVKSTHDAWSVVCDKPPGASSDQCVLMQNVLSEDRPELGLSVVVLKTADRKAKILRVLAPLGVLLLPPKGGLGLNVDGKDLGHAYFARCFADGCYAEVTLDDDLLKTLRSGSVATFIVHESLEQDGIGIPVDLKGFAGGYDALP
nr:invasion associated locus B family protein [uncultured Gellertiella sp.]